MAMICKMCGNTEEFRQDVSGQKYVQGTRYLDGEEEETDLEMNDEDDIEWEDEDAITCVDCDNEDIQEGLTEREVNQIIWEHTDKEGEWL